MRYRHPERLTAQEEAELGRSRVVDAEAYLRWLETGDGPESRLRDLPGVDAVFQSHDGRTFYVVAREHDAIDWDRLLKAETEIRATVGPYVFVTVRAHQGRDPGELFAGLAQL